MKKKNQKPTKPIKQIILFIIAVILLLLIIFAEDIIKLNNKNKMNLAENSENELIANEPNIPELSAGMIPVKYENGNWRIIAEEDEDTNWYDYEHGQPAYVMLNNGTYQSEFIPDMTNKKLAEDNVGVGVSDDPNIRGSIYLWIPRFAYKETDEIGYIKEEVQPGGEWIVPEIFSYTVSDETIPDFSLSGVWVEKDVNTACVSTITEMQNEGGIYGFIDNTKPKQITSTDINTIQNYINTLTANTVGNNAPVVPQINNIINTNRIILQIINTNKFEPIKANISHNKTEQRIDITVPYTKNGISKILDENGTPMTLTKIDGIITANTGDEELEEKDYIFTVVDNEGNKMQLKITITFGIEANAITASMYGAEVTNYSVGGVNKWRIFHSDGTNIYLIADYYVPNTYLPETSTDSSSSGKTLSKSGTYNAYWNTTILGRYTGSEWIRSKQSTIANKWLTWVNSHQTSTNKNIKAIAYMLDTKAWNKFANSRYADYVIGGPTIEMYCASYKVTHPSKYIEWSSTSSIYGYKVKWSTDSTYTYNVYGLNTTKEYNGIYITESSNSNANGYWLASPYSYDANALLRANYDGEVHGASYNSTAFGFRPLVCLKSGIKLQDNGDGTYSIN